MVAARLRMGKPPLEGRGLDAFMEGLTPEGVSYRAARLGCVRSEIPRHDVSCLYGEVGLRAEGRLLFED